jgi:phosphatidylinositol glycan class B
LFQNKWLIKGISLLLVLNFIFLLVATFRPANPAVNFYRFLYSKPEIKRLVALDEDPFTMLGLPISFYKPDTLEVFVTKPENLRWQGEIYLFTRSGEDLILWSKNDKCQQLYTAYPVWALQYNWGNWIGRSRVWSLFKCQKP